jgi:molybdenum cofactor biosynthesis enzyme MoaA
MASTTDRLLISQEDFFEYETITANTDPQKILPYIREAQKFDLTSVLNTELIEDLQDNPELARNAALMQYVRPVLCYYSYGRYVQITEWLQRQMSSASLHQKKQLHA